MGKTSNFFMGITPFCSRGAIPSTDDYHGSLIITHKRL
nr:MAG TPA: hypothetical protein [Caudoviricetes sp.]